MKVSLCLVVMSMAIRRGSCKTKWLRLRLQVAMYTGRLAVSLDKGIPAPKDRNGISGSLELITGSNQVRLLCEGNDIEMQFQSETPELFDLRDTSYLHPTGYCVLWNAWFLRGWFSTPHCATLEGRGPLLIPTHGSIL